MYNIKASSLISAAF
uniref:Uncharacterized protein n=1 Tax=Anguilla anguilla TaxID=7936 RepID=A0A0E9VXH5_ANGAN